MSTATHAAVPVKSGTGESAGGSNFRVHMRQMIELMLMQVPMFVLEKHQRSISAVCVRAESACVMTLVDASPSQRMHVMISVWSKLTRTELNAIFVRLVLALKRRGVLYDPRGGSLLSACVSVDGAETAEDVAALMAAEKRSDPETSTSMPVQGRELRTVIRLLTLGGAHAKYAQLRDDVLQRTADCLRRPEALSIVRACHARLLLAQ